MKAVIIAEDFAGMRAQGAGLAEKAGLDRVFRPVVIRPPWNRIPARFWPDPLARVAPIEVPADAGVIIGVGGTGGIVAAALARRAGLPVAQVQNPRTSLKKFDLVVASAHDAISGPNVVISRNALHPVTPQKLEEARARWMPVLRPDSRPLISIMLGGANGRYHLGPAEAADLAQRIAGFVRGSGMRAALTHSRRTAPEALAVLRERLAPEGAWFGEGTGEENPYMGMLACAELIAVTTDSVSMISEAAATPAPVAILPLPGRSARISRFIATLQDAGRVRPFDAALAPWPVSPLDDTPHAAQEMRRRLVL